MIIQTTIRVAKAKPKVEPSIQSLATADHDMAWSSDDDEQVILTGETAKVAAPESAEWQVASLENLDGQDAKKARALKKAYLKLGLNGTSLVSQYFPEALGQPVEGIELIVASYSAFDAWSDQERSNNVEPSLATAKVVLESIDVLSPFFPVLAKVQPYSKVLGLAVKTAESAYLVYQAHNELNEPGELSKPN